MPPSRELAAAYSARKAKAPGELAREAVRSTGREQLPQHPDWQDYPGGLEGDAFHTAMLEHDLTMLEILLRAACEAVAAAGYDPDNPAVAMEVESGILRGWEEREAAGRYEMDRRSRYLAEHVAGWPVENCSSPRDRDLWFRINRPASHGVRHRRAPGRKPTHRRGSRRGASSSAGGGDPPDGESDPDDIASSPLARELQAASDELLASWRAERGIRCEQPVLEGWPA